LIFEKDPKNHKEVLSLPENFYKLQKIFLEEIVEKAKEMFDCEFKISDDNLRVIGL
jgi:hypothetical protein